MEFGLLMKIKVTTYLKIYIHMNYINCVRGSLWLPQLVGYENQKTKTKQIWNFLAGLPTL